MTEQPSTAARVALCRQLDRRVHRDNVQTLSNRAHRVLATLARHGYPLVMYGCVQEIQWVHKITGHYTQCIPMRQYRATFACDLRATRAKKRRTVVLARPLLDAAACPARERMLHFSRTKGVGRWTLRGDESGSSSSSGSGSIRDRAVALLASYEGCAELSAALSADACALPSAVLCLVLDYHIQPPELVGRHGSVQVILRGRNTSSILAACVAYATQHGLMQEWQRCQGNAWVQMARRWNSFYMELSVVCDVRYVQREWRNLTELRRRTILKLTAAMGVQGALDEFRYMC